MTDEAIMAENIPTGIPLVYQLNEDLRSLTRDYLGDPEAVKRAAAAVASQGKART